MTIKIFICILMLGVMNAEAEQFKISGFEISFSDGCRISLSLNGSIRNITLPAGDIKENSSKEIKSVGSAEITRDSSGNIKGVGSAEIKRDSAGRIKSVGGIDIKRDSSNKIKSVGAAEIKRDSSGRIKSVYSNGEYVQPVFLVSSKN